MVGTTPALDSRDGFLGKPLPGYSVHLVAEGCPTEQGPGELCIDISGRPAGLMAGYVNATGTLKPMPGAGYYRTGDVAVRDQNGYIRVLGRADDVFKSYDHRLSPYEIEAVIRRHPSVREAAVVPEPHPVGGAVPVAFVELVEGAHSGGRFAEELARHCAGHLAPHARPRSFTAISSLPRTTSGKVKRATLADSARVGSQYSS